MLADSLYIFKVGMTLSVMLSGPVLVIVVLLGIVVSLLQAAFQMQDQTLPLFAKLVITVVILAFTWNWMSTAMIDFTNNVFSRIEELGD
ncbi:MAG: type secretion protein HrpO family [Rhizobacter sp.]|nr:type secretion protein HrpO family [Rhizobacter sp.]